jgi:hypothetical protein
MKAKHNRTSKKSHRKSARSQSGGRTSRPAVGVPPANTRVLRRGSNHRRSGEPAEENPQTRAANQSGDLTGITDEGFSAGESTAELMEEGQDLEAELVLGVEEAPDADKEEVPTPRTPRSRLPDYGTRNRL